MKSRHMADGELGERVTFHTTPIVKTTKSNKSVESEEIERLHLATEDTWGQEDVKKHDFNLSDKQVFR